MALEKDRNDRQCGLCESIVEQCENGLVRLGAGAGGVCEGGGGGGRWRSSKHFGRRQVIGKGR